MFKFTNAFSAMVLLLTQALYCQVQTPVPIAGAEADLSKEAVVVEHTSDKVKFENDGTYVWETSARARLLSDAGIQRLGVLTFPYEEATGTFEIDYVRVRKPDGTVVVTPPDGIQDMPAQITREAPFYSDLREKQVAVKGLGIGDVLEYATRHHITKPLVSGQFWFQYNFAHDGVVQDEQFEVAVPREREIKLKSDKVKPVISEAGQYRVYRWQTSNLERQNSDDKKKEKRELDRVLWERVRGRVTQPDVMLSSFTSWEEVGSWYNKLQAPRVEPTPAVQAKASEITKGAATDRAKLEAIYHYVSTKFRYIGVSFGIGRYQPHAASEVLDNQYGDCKDKHTLLAALLGAAGIRAYPALINTAREIDADVPSPGQFDHAITVVPEGNELLWLDTTAEVGPFRYLSSNLRGKHALVVFDAKPSALLGTAENLPFASQQIFRMKSKLSDQGVLEASAEFTVRGDLEYALRRAFRSVPVANWAELAQRVSYGMGFSGDVSEVNAGAPEKTDEPFHLTYKYTRKDFGDWSNGHTLAAMPSMSLPSLNDEDSASSTPVWLGEPTELDFRSEMQLPSDHRPELPAASHEKRAFAEYDATYSFKDGALLAQRRFRNNAREIQPVDYDEYKKFRKIVEDDYGSYIPLNSMSSGLAIPANASLASLSAETPDWQKALSGLAVSSNPEATRLEETARQATAHNDVQGAISALYRAVSADPKYTRAWILLGTLLMASHQRDGALDAFHRGIESDPSQPLAYKALGFSLMANSQLEEAIKVWQDFIKIAPADADGPANLGTVFVQLERFPEAISALESAARLSPNNPVSFQQLARAYLYSGAEEKAGEVLRKLESLSPSPNTLNNVAYELAVMGKQLPLALQFAKKAVEAEEKASQQTTLAQLKIEDVDRTVRLFAYWDTLGWVHARMSNPVQAKKYLTAAWILSRNGGIADHLCEVHEQLKETEAAVRMCQLALNRLPLTNVRPEEGTSEMNELRARLERLRPGSSKANSAGMFTDEPDRMRTFKLPRIVPGTATAEFFVLLVSDPKSSTFKVEDAGFASGSPLLGFGAKALKTINFKLDVPGDVPTRIVRRGIVGCYTYTGCSFVVLDPDTVHSVN